MTSRLDQLRAMREAQFAEAEKPARRPKVLNKVKKAKAALDKVAKPSNVGRPPKSEFRTPDGRFDRKAYMRAVMRKRRAKGKEREPEPAR